MEEYFQTTNEIAMSLNFYPRFSQLLAEIPSSDSIKPPKVQVVDDSLFDHPSRLNHHVDLIIPSIIFHHKIPSFVAIYANTGELPMKDSVIDIENDISRMVGISISSFARKFLRLLSKNRIDEAFSFLDFVGN